MSACRIEFLCDYSDFELCVRDRPRESYTLKEDFYKCIIILVTNSLTPPPFKISSWTVCDITHQWEELLPVLSHNNCVCVLAVCNCESSQWLYRKQWQCLWLSYLTWKELLLFNHCQTTIVILSYHNSRYFSHNHGVTSV